ncbi:MAG TPA: hypothetical protein G4O13_00975 [Dehalococcoidia bacterium]|nr:hypothetical protein [Dehalococcoidia bacterium]
MQAGQRSDLRHFFEPDAIAVIASMKDGSGLGYRTITNLRNFGFRGRIYPINPYYDEVLGLKSYSDVTEVGEPIDLAIVITPPPTVPAIIEQCAHSGVKAALIVSENFAEAGGEGAELQRELVEIVRRTGIRVMGPNTIGIVNPAAGLITAPYYVSYQNVQRGGVAYCSQTGFVGPTAQPLRDYAYPISKTCDVGNKCDVNEVDLLNYLADDPDTRVVAMHLEDIRDGRGFIEAARRLVPRKPLLVFKAGRTEAGARASASHTSSLAGDEQVYDSAFKQAGAIRVRSWQEFWEVPRVFSSQPLPRGNRVAIVSHTGGAGVVATDTAVEAGLTVASFSAETLEKLAEMSFRLTTNPMDMGPILSVAENAFQIQEDGLAAALDDPNVDCAALAVYGGLEQLVSPMVEMFVRLMQNRSKTVVIWIYGMQLPAMQEMRRQLEAQGLPAYIDFETAMKALGAAARYVEIRREFER